MGQPGARHGGPIVIFGEQTRGAAARADVEILFLPRAARQRERARRAEAGLEAELARAILAAGKLPRAKAGLACPALGEGVHIAADATRGVQGKGVCRRGEFGGGGTIKK